MPAETFLLPFRPAIDPNGLTVSGAQLYFYASGTSTPQNVYADEALTVPLMNPVMANAAGKWPTINLDNTLVYRVVLRDGEGAILAEADPYVVNVTDPLEADLQAFVDAAAAQAVNAGDQAANAAAQVVLAGLQASLAEQSAALAAAQIPLAEAEVGKAQEWAAEAGSHEVAARLAKDQAADLVQPHNIFVDIPLTTVESIVPEGITFKIVDSALGQAQVRRRDATASTLLYREVTREGLASSDVNKGAALIGLPGYEDLLAWIDERPVSITKFGAVADTTELVAGTDNKLAFEAALATGRPVYVPRPPAGYAYGVSNVVLPRRAKIIGPSMYALAIRGISAQPAISASDQSADLVREITFEDLWVENNRGGDAVNLNWCPDLNFTRVYFRSVSNNTLGTTAKRGLNMKNCERSVFSGQIRIGGNPALRMSGDCNGATGLCIVASGGSLGLAVDLSGNQTVRLKLIIETSLYGVRLGDNTGENAGPVGGGSGGWGSGADLSNSYFENVGAPVIAGLGFAQNGLNLDYCWCNNEHLADGDPFPPAGAMLDIGRVKSLSLRGGRWKGAGTEFALRLREHSDTSGSAPGALETSDIDLTVFENVAGLFDHSALGVGSVANKARAAATNRIRVDDFGQGWGVPFDWISPPLSANVGYTQTAISAPFPGGGIITKVEIIEGDGGSMNGARIRVGGNSASNEILDKTFGLVNPTYEDQGVTAGLLRPNDGLRFRLDAGPGAAKFRVRIRGFVGTA